MGKLLVSEEIKQKLNTNLLSQQSTSLYDYAYNKAENSDDNTFIGIDMGDGDYSCMCEMKREDDKYVVMEYKYSYQMPIIKDGIILSYDTEKVSKSMRNIFDKINKNEIKFADNKELLKELNKLKF